MELETENAILHLKLAQVGYKFTWRNINYYGGGEKCTCDMSPSYSYCFSNFTISKTRL